MLRSAFTFHYVSIKSDPVGLPTLPNINLHSTMYLLNHDVTDKTTEKTEFTFHYVSIKSSGSESNKTLYKGFTFHYVSIKSVWDHKRRINNYVIYIPLCIY